MASDQGARTKIKAAWAVVEAESLKLNRAVAERNALIAESGMSCEALAELFDLSMVGAAQVLRESGVRRRVELPPIPPASTKGTGLGPERKDARARGLPAGEYRRLRAVGLSHEEALFPVDANVQADDYLLLRLAGVSLSDCELAIDAIDGASVYREEADGMFKIYALLRQWGSQGESLGTALLLGHSGFAGVEWNWVDAYCGAGQMGASYFEVTQRRPVLYRLTSTFWQPKANELGDVATLLAFPDDQWEIVKSFADNWNGSLSDLLKACRAITSTA